MVKHNSVHHLATGHVYKEEMASGQRDECTEYFS